MRKQRGQTIVAMMIVLVIILVLVVVFFGVRKSGDSPRADKKGYTNLGLVRYSALDTKCQSDIQQLRLSIKMTHDSNVDEGYPATLEDTKLGEEFYKCPVGGEKYVYDPATGEVHCPHPGHEKY
ncbi:MAG TPA: prepilin-type N-terminal cleavage/methylation domain-containing protein [Fimbriimonadaceae bacterium]|jgi:competence protein ComGC